MSEFRCPKCGATHRRGFLNGVDVYRCLGCGYVGFGFHPNEQIDVEIAQTIRAEQKWQTEHGLPPGPFAPDEAAWHAERPHAR